MPASTVDRHALERGTARIALKLSLEAPMQFFILALVSDAHTVHMHDDGIRCVCVGSVVAREAQIIRPSARLLVKRASDIVYTYYVCAYTKKEGT